MVPSFKLIPVERSVGVVYCGGKAALIWLGTGQRLPG